MILKIGDKAPDFQAKTTEGDISFHDWLGNSWGVLFSHPADFTPICTTELGAASKMKQDFEKRNVKIAALSVNDLESHHSWIKDINETQNTTVNFPLIADPERKIAILYGMVTADAPNTQTVRNVFIMDPNKVIKIMITYPPSTGRNFQELLRTIDSLQLTQKYSVATPVDWKQGEDVIIIPAVSDEEAKKKFPKGFRSIRPYLRVTPQPDR